uniref:Uncharacterized protein n=1 Tax=Pyricularia oryzae (strain P131) TaxID=1143193 RepID=L7JQN0_PYRO1
MGAIGIALQSSSRSPAILPRE